MRRRSLRTLALVAVAALAVAAPAAASAPALVVKHVDTSAWPKVTVTAETPDPSTTPELKVFENGQAAQDVRLANAGQPGRGRGRDRHIREHARPEDRRCHRRGDDVRHGVAVGRLAGRVRVRLPALPGASRFPATSTAAAGGLAPARHRRPSRHRHLRRRQDGRAGARGPADAATGDRPSDRRLVRPRLGHVRPGRSPRPSRPTPPSTRSASRAPRPGRPPCASSRPRPAASSCRRPIALPWSRPTPRSRPTSRARSRFTYHSLVPKGTPIHLALSVPGYGSARASAMAPGTRAAQTGGAQAAPAHAHERRRARGGGGGCRGARALRGAHPALVQARRGGRQAHRRLHRAEEAGDRDPGRRARPRSACSPSCSRPRRRSPARSTTGSGWPSGSSRRTCRCARPRSSTSRWAPP